MIIRQHRIYRADLRANPTVLYVFGDNECRFGLGGQAGEMRGEPNAVGIATLYAPGMFWVDAGVNHQSGVIRNDMIPLFRAVLAGRTVVWPNDGVGSGLADLERASPRTWAFLLGHVALLFQGAAT